MPIYGVKLIKTSIAWRVCSECNRLIHPGEKMFRLYGCAETGDRPYHVYVHFECGWRVRDSRVDALLTPADYGTLTSNEPNR